MARQLGRRDALRLMAASALLAPRLARADDDTSVPEQIVDTMNALFGKHPGFRSAHAKGIVCEGEFTPAAAAATLSKAPHLQDKPVRVTVRFSDSTGIPDIPDAGPRGMAGPVPPARRRQHRHRLERLQRLRRRQWRGLPGLPPRRGRYG
jgi:hypothetical protein